MIKRFLANSQPFIQRFISKAGIINKKIEEKNRKILKEATKSVEGNLNQLFCNIKIEKRLTQKNSKLLKKRKKLKLFGNFVVLSCFTSSQPHPKFHRFGLFVSLNYLCLTFETYFDSSALRSILLSYFTDPFLGQFFSLFLCTRNFFVLELTV